jgi:hypothetical protein
VLWHECRILGRPIKANRRAMNGLASRRRAQEQQKKAREPCGFPGPFDAESNDRLVLNLKDYDG